MHFIFHPLRSLILLFIISISLFSYGQNIHQLKATVDSLSELDSKLTLDQAKKLEKLSKNPKQDKTELQEVYATLAKVFFKHRSFNKSIKYFEKELEFLESSSNRVQLSESYYNIGSTCMKMRKLSKAKSYYEKSLIKAKEVDETSLIYANYNALVVVNEKLVNYKKASEYLKKLIEADKGLFNDQVNLYKKQVVQQKRLVKKKTKQLDISQKTLDTAKKTLDTTKKTLDTATIELLASAKTIDFLEEDTLRKKMQIYNLNFQKLLRDYEIEAKDDELKAEKQFQLLLIIGIFLVSILAIFIFFLLLSKRRMNDRLKMQKEYILSQNESITQSIQYASKIQKAALPKTELFNQVFKDHFVLLKPRDIVSGDFYFLQTVNDHVVFSAVDCTGHGVPGAFMSMLGIAFLNDIIRKKEVIQADQILNLLREQIKLSLHQTSDRDGQKDGMDMAVGVLNKNDNTLQYSGAHNPLIIVRDGALIEYKADRMPVGIHLRETPFMNHSIQLKKNDKLYMYSDGFADQVGGVKNKKYQTRALKQLLLKTSDLTMPEQKELLQAEFDQWKGDNSQIDDLVILGIEV